VNAAANATAGTAVNFTVSALDNSGNVVTSYAGTVHFTSSDSQATLPANSALTNGTGSFTVTLKTAGSQTITASDSTINGTSSGVTVNPGAAKQLSVSAPAAATVALPIAVTVTAQDAYMNVATSYTGTVHFSLAKADPQAVLPTDSQLANGTKSFPGVILGTVSAQTIRATDTVTASITGACNTINVVSNAATKLAITGPSSIGTRAPFDFTVTAVDAAGNPAAGYSGTVHFTSSDTQAILPADAKVTSASPSFSAWFETAGQQTFSVTDTANSALTGQGSVGVTKTADPTINSSAPPNGQVGANYGITGYQKCILTYYRYQHYVCSPCTPGPAGCGHLPPCNGVNSPCLEAVHFGFTATAGIQPYSWSISGLPPGLSPENNEILGVPTTPNSYNITVTVTDSGKPAVQISSSYAVKISPPPIPSVANTPPPPPGVLNQPYQYAFSATGYKTLTWSWVAAAGSSLPPGLSLSASGVLSGKTTQTGSFSIAVTAQDQFQQNSNPANFTIVVSQHGFVVIGNMTTARVNHTATLLGTNKVLIAGGDSSGTAELFDPSTGSFTATGSMQVARNAHTATLLPGGQVLVAAGITQQASMENTAELYDPTAATFTLTKGTLQTGRYGHTATLLNNGKVLIAGGCCTNAASLGSAELFDPATGTFSSTGSMNSPRQGHTATLLPSGKVLITGGFDANNTHLATAELYDPATGSFTTAKGMMTATRVDHTATLLTVGANAGKVLLAGGYNDNGNPASTAELFDPTNESFTAAGTMVAARYNHTATLLNDGTVLLAGGFGLQGVDTALTAAAEVYDPASGNFTVTGSLVIARTRHAATLLPDGRVLATGGAGALNPALISAEIYLNQ
jgi:hypothetical protein